MDMSFFDWSYLGTFAGALAAVALITELIKELPGLKKVPTQFVSWILAFVILILAQLFTGTLSAQNAGGYAALKRVVGGKDEENKE